MMKIDCCPGGSRERSDIDRFRSGRNGDDLLMSFECDFCVFEKLFGRDTWTGFGEGCHFAMACIRRVNLDACWSRASSTVQANTYKVREGLSISHEDGDDRSISKPWSLYLRHDHCGYEVAIQMVVASLDTGAIFKLTQAMGDH
jgi:hypothetical protein